MNEELLFTEKQQFRQWWLWILMLGITAFSLFSSYQTFLAISKEKVEIERMIGMFIAIVTPLLPILIFLVLKLETKITREGIYVRFFPLQLKFKFYNWEGLTKCYIRQYSALAEYGGWGLRLGLMGSGRAYNVSGNKGLQLETTNGKKLLIGTNKPDQLMEVLLSLSQIKE